MSNLYYQRHLFICTNQREEGASCCNNMGATALHAYAKKRCKELGFKESKIARANRAGCLGRCDLGPIAVVYPEGVWYTYIDEIIESHLQNGKIVERLRVE